jgi:glycosyltransferase involved in cell wall biosynthesis
MTTSADPAEPSKHKDTPGEPPLGASWRARALAAQEQSLPSGRVVVSCGVPYGGGGLGRHLQEIVEALDRRGQEREYICDSNRPARSRFRPRAPRPSTLLAPVAGLSPGLRVRRARVEFDEYAAGRLPRAEHLLAFNRQALAQFRAARRSGYSSASLVTGSPHVKRVARQHALAYSAYPLERSFGTYVIKRYLTEYEQADRIYVASRYTWESFAEQGIPEEKLSLFPLTPDPRFQPARERSGSSTFDIVYAGSLSVAKGIPLLIDAFRRLEHDDLRLVLVGSWKTRGMRRFIEQAIARDGRIQAGPGDPLAALHRARLCVHPTYEDGFAYAPAEALACGVPVLVSADTGMKELIDPDRTGMVLPTGNLQALSDAMDGAYCGEILGG